MLGDLGMKGYKFTLKEGKEWSWLDGIELESGCSDTRLKDSLPNCLLEEPYYF